MSKDIKQSKWEEELSLYWNCDETIHNKEDKTIKQFISSLLSERDKQWLSCLPNYEYEKDFDVIAGAYNQAIDDTFTNAKKLNLIK